MLGRYVLRQFAQPHGRLGGLFAELLNRGNAAVNDRALAALQPREGDRVLEVGFGGGAALAEILRNSVVAFAGGLDPSAEMIRRAEQRLSGPIQEGRLQVRLGAAEAIPWPDASFDRALSVNSIYYWRDPARGASELFRVLKPGGTAVLGLRSKVAIDRLKLDRFDYHPFGEDDVRDLLERAGFSAIDISSHEDRRFGGAVVVRARRS